MNVVLARAALMAGVALAALPAAAQTAPTPTDATSAGTVAAPAAATPPNAGAVLTNGAGIEEIVVTAQRVEQRLQDIPLSVTALSGAALKNANITDVTRLEQLVPGLRVGRSGSDARFAIRGVFTEAIGANADPRIGFYVDDVYQSRTSQALTAFVDQERVEVQKGPQGTLYGRNSFGGNIALYSAVPKDSFSAGVDGLYGTFNRARVEGFVNVPLTSGVAARIAGSYERQDGYVKNTSTGSNLGDEDAYFVRGTLRVAPAGSRFEAVVRGSYYKQGGNGISAFGYKSIGTLVDPSLIRAPGGSITLPGGRVLTFPGGFNGTAFTLGTFANPVGVPFNSRFRDGIPDINGADIGLPIERDPYKINFDTVTIRRTDQKQFSGNLSYDFGGIKLRSITSYTDFYAIRSSDNDFSPFPIAVDFNQTRTQTFTQEVQLLSTNRNARFQWIIGGYYFDDKIDERFFSQNNRAFPAPGQQPVASLFSNTFLPGGAAPFNTPITRARSDNFSPVQASTKSYAGFVQATLKLTRTVSVTGGYRYTSDQKRYAAGVGQAAAAGSYLAFDLNQPVDYSCAAAGGTNLNGRNPSRVDPAATGLAPSPNGIAGNGIGINCGRKNFNFSTWRGAIDWKIAPENLLYFSASRGIHSGGFNNVVNALTGNVIPFDSEEVVAYEAGSKNRFAGGKVQINAALFYNDFRNLQIQSSVPAPNGLTVLSVITNAGKSRAYGAELEAILKPTRELTFQIAFNYLNARDTSLVLGTSPNGLCGVVAGGCPAPAAGATPEQIQAQLLANAFGIGPQGAPFPSPATDPARFQQVFLPNGQPAVQGGNLPIYNYVVAGTLSDGRKVSSPTPLSPEYTVQSGVSYDIDLGEYGTITPSVQTFLSASFINTAFAPSFGKQQAFTKTDARLSWISANKRFTVQGFIENIENTAVLTRVAFGGNRSLNAVYQLPQTYGIRAGVRF